MSHPRRIEELEPGCWVLLGARFLWLERRRATARVLGLETEAGIVHLFLRCLTPTVGAPNIACVRHLPMLWSALVGSVLGCTRGLATQMQGDRNVAAWRRKWMSGDAGAFTVSPWEALGLIEQALGTSAVETDVVDPDTGMFVAIESAHPIRSADGTFSTVVVQTQICGDAEQGGDEERGPGGARTR